MLQGEESALSTMFRRVQDILFMDVQQILGGRAARPPIQPRRPSGRVVRRPSQAAEGVASRASTFEVSGEIRRGLEAPYAVNDTEFFLVDSTWVFGDVQIGAQATVTVCAAQGKLVAKKIVIARPG